MGKKLYHLSLKIDKDLAQDLKRLAAKDHSSKTQLIKNAITEYQKPKADLNQDLLEGQYKILNSVTEIKNILMLQQGYVPAKTEPVRTEKVGILQRLRSWRK